MTEKVSFSEALARLGAELRGLSAVAARLDAHIGDLADQCNLHEDLQQIDLMCQTLEDLVGVFDSLQRSEPGRPLDLAMLVEGVILKDVRHRLSGQVPPDTPVRNGAHVELF